MKKPPRAPHTAFSTELRGGSRALKARLGNLFSAGKTRAPLLVAAALLVTVLAGGLVACTQTPAPGPTPSPTPTDGHLPVDTVGQARIAMELQYYDTLQNIYEAPILADAESDAAQSINAEIEALVSAWRADIATAYEHVNSQVFAFPSTAGRYLNIILLEVPGGTGSDGFIHTWVYDAEKAVRVTGEEALSLAGVSLAELEPLAADLFLTENPGTTLQLTALELAGFRIRSDGGPELYLYGQTDDPTGNMDPWQCVYLWADGALTRCANLAYPQASYSPFRLLVPLEEVDKTELPLWCTWGPSGGEPQGGFVTPALPEGAAAFESQLRETILPEYGGLVEGEAFVLDYQGTQQTEGWDFWIFDLYRGDSATGFGTDACLGRYLKDQNTGQVFFQQGPDWFLATIPGTYAFPQTIDVAAEWDTGLWSDVQRHVWRQVPETGFEYGHVNFSYPTLTLTASYPDLGLPNWYGVGVYHCPVSLPEVPDWTDSTPYMAFIPVAGGGYYYLGDLDEAGARSKDAVSALVDEWMTVDVKYLNFVTGGSDAYDSYSGFYTNDAYHFTLQLPEELYNAILFRDTGRGVGIYYRPAYERYVAERGGVDDGGVSAPLACGRLFEILAGPDLNQRYDANIPGFSWLPMCQSPDNEADGVPAANGWCYAALTSTEWYPGSAYHQEYERQLRLALSSMSVNPV